MDTYPTSRVAIRRRALGISQDALARRAGISGRYAALIDRGEANPSISVAQRVAAALECGVSDLWPPGGAHREGGAR